MAGTKDDPSKRIQSAQTRGTSPKVKFTPPNTPFTRMVVVDVIHDPTVMTDGMLAVYNAEHGLQKIDFAKTLPRNTLVAKFTNVNSDGHLRPAMFLFPLLPPHISLPVSPGEHVWAMIEKTDAQIGYWFCRITEPWHVDDLNHTHPPRLYEQTYAADSAEDPLHQFYNGIPEGTGDNRTIPPGSDYISGGDSAYVDLIKRGPQQVNAMNLVKDAAVPRFKKRPGDLVLEGKNNTLLVMGIERRGVPAEYDIKTKDLDFSGRTQAIQVITPRLPSLDDPHGGMIDIVVGRGKTNKTSGVPVINDLGLNEIDKSIKASVSNPEEGNPDLIKDDSRIRLSQSIYIDDCLGLVNLNSKEFGINDAVTGDAGIVIKTDKARIIARKDLEILVAADDAKPEDCAAIVIKASTGDIVFRPSKSGYIKLGSDKADKAILCTSKAATPSNGKVSASPITQPVGRVNPDTATVTVDVGTGVGDAGTFASKVLVDG